MCTTSVFINTHWQLVTSDAFLVWNVTNFVKKEKREGEGQFNSRCSNDYRLWWFLPIPFYSPLKNTAYLFDKQDLAMPEKAKKSFYLLHGWQCEVTIIMTWLRSLSSLLGTCPWGPFESLFSYASQVQRNCKVLATSFFWKKLSKMMPHFGNCLASNSNVI